MNATYLNPPPPPSSSVLILGDDDLLSGELELPPDSSDHATMAYSRKLPSLAVARRLAAAAAATAATTAPRASAFSRTEAPVAPISSDDAFETLPLGIRLRTMVDGKPTLVLASSPSTKMATPASVSVAPAPTVSAPTAAPPIALRPRRASVSDAQVAITLAGERATRFLRERSKRPAWLAGAGASLVLVAIATGTVLRLGAPSVPATGSSATTEAAAAPIVSTPVLLPTSPVVRFDDSDGVSIKAAPARASTPAPHAAPHARPTHSAPRMTALPDGSLGLSTKTAAAASSSASASTSIMPPSAKSKKPLSPEQELLEAQLRAATR